MCCTTHWLKCLHEGFSCHLHGHPRCAVVRSLTFCSLPFSFPCVSPISSSSSTWTLTCTSSSMWSSSGQFSTGTPPNEESGPLAQNTLSQGMSPSSLTTSTSRRLLKSSSGTNPATRCPRTCLTRNSTMRPSAERSLHHCSFRSEKNRRTVDKLITLLKKVCCQLSPFAVCHSKNGETCARI